MDVIRIDVTSERGTYPVVIGPGVTAGLPAQLRALEVDRDVLVVSCLPVWRAHGKRLARVVGSHRPALIPDGERAKALSTVARVYEALVARRFDRSGAVLAFGGGVVGDVAGFAAATYLRGIRLVQVPTTLLSQVDSAIGGKTGVNLPVGKNLVGSFHSPALVACDPLLLRSLPRREFRGGLYEVVKYGVIGSAGLFDRLFVDLSAIFGQDAAVLTRVIAECCRIKAEVVSADERESGPRRILNFGHTIGHALEAITRYRRFRHGEAIGYGMLAAARLSAARGTLTLDDERRLRDLIAQLGPLPPVADLRIGDALDAITRDKKVLRRRLHFVLAQGIGATVIVSDVRPTELRSSMKAIGMRA